jgi:hypothetical protein
MATEKKPVLFVPTQEDVYELKGSLVYKIDILLDFREQLLC